MQDNYNDIIDLPHHQSARHPHMPIEERAPQFSPFAALAGYEDTIMEAGRQISQEKILAEDQKEELDAILVSIQERAGEHPHISVTYFQPDKKKDGGEYMKKIGRLKQVDRVRHQLVFEDGTVIPAWRISDIILQK